MIRVAMLVLAVAHCAVAQQSKGMEEKRELDLIAPNSAEQEFTAIRDAYVEKYRPLFITAARAWWEANTTGSDAAFDKKQRAEMAIVELHSDRATFARLKELKADHLAADPVLARELDVMYRAFLPGQADPAVQKQIVEIENQVEQIFNTHRSEVDAKALTENDVREILGGTRDMKKAQAAWMGYMAVGAKVEAKLAELVRLRNRLARELGFRNFWAMSMVLSEIDGDDLIRLFDELDALTAGPFADLKRGIDQAMAERFGIAVDELRPWCFGDLFFQEAPPTQAFDLDDLFKDRDLLALTKAYYESIGLEVDDIIARSDLYEKPGKSPHAFSTDLDRAGDVRTLCNLKPNAYWMDTLLHELGHAVYDKYIDQNVPFLLHEASHSITTEGFAMMLGSMCKNEEWLVKVAQIDPSKRDLIIESARDKLRAEKLIFSRWGQVIVRFEKAMYEDPDQDLGRLWWDLKARYQRLPPPDSASRPDYAAKMHVVAAPVYYHSYIMGDLFACQVHQRIASEVIGASDPSRTCYFGRKDAGDYLKKYVFGPGNLYSWNELTRRATGEPLTAKYFAQQYVNK
jgi:peptidyl-dipeptidase A